MRKLHVNWLILIYMVVIGTYLLITGASQLFNPWGAVLCFANLRLLVVHLLCCLPLSWVLVDSILSNRPLQLDRSPVSVIVLLVVLCALAPIGCVAALSIASDYLLELESGLEIRTAIRIVMCLASTLPIVLLLYVLDDRFRPKAAGATRLCIVIASVFIASVYGWKQTLLARQAYRSTTNSPRIALSLKRLSQLIELDSSPLALAEEGYLQNGTASLAQNHGGLIRPRTQLELLRDQAEKLENEVALFIEVGLKVNQSQVKLNLSALMTAGPIAANLISLGRLREAEEVLALMPKNDRNATLLRATISKDLQDWNGLLIHADILLSEDSNHDFLVYSLKGDALIGLGRRADALAFFEDVFQKCDTGKADAAIRIARLAMDDGNRELALLYLDRIERLSPDRTDEVRSLRRTIATNACDLRGKAR